MMLPQVSSELERMWLVRQVGLADHLGLARIGDVDGGEILRRALVRQPDDAAAVRRDLHRHAFAHAAEAVEQVVGEQLEIPGDGAVGRCRWARCGRTAGFFGAGFFAAAFFTAFFLAGLRGFLAAAFSSSRSR